MPRVDEETPEQIQARRPPKPRHHTVSEEAEREQLGRKQAWKQSQAERQPVPLRPPRPAHIGGPPRTATFVNEALGRKTVAKNPPPPKRPRPVVEMEDDSSDEDMADEVPTKKAETEKVAAQKAALERRVEAAKAAAEKGAERKEAHEKRLAAEKAKQQEEAAAKEAAKKEKLHKLGKKPVVPARTHTTPCNGYLQCAFHPFVPAELAAVRQRYNSQWCTQLAQETDRKYVLTVGAMNDLSNHCALSFGARGNAMAFWINNIVQELEQREWVNPMPKRGQVPGKEQFYLWVVAAALSYNLHVFAEVHGVAGNNVADRVELVVYNKQRAANRALIKQMTTKLHNWYVAQGISVPVQEVKEMMAEEDKFLGRMQGSLQNYRDTIDNPTDINTRLKDSEVTLRAQDHQNKVFFKNRAAAQRLEHDAWNERASTAHTISYGLFQASMAAADTYVDHCKGQMHHYITRRTILDKNIHNSTIMTTALQKEAARQLAVIDKIEKRYWTPKLQACDDADAMAVWLSKRKGDRNTNYVELFQRAKVRDESLREIHARCQRLHDTWNERASSAHSLKLLLHAHISHATILGAPAHWQSPVPTRASLPPAPAPAPEEEDDDGGVEVMGEKSWEERDKELRAQAQYVG